MEFVIVWVLLAAGVGALASSRGRSGWGFFLLALLLSPLLGLIVVLVTPNLVERREQEEQRRRDHERELAALQAVAGAPRPLTTPPAQATPVAGPPPVSVADELGKLAGLLERGLLTQQEFDAQKARLLGVPLPAVAAPPPEPSAPSASPAVTRMEPMGVCPNCSTMVARAALECPKCKADFGPGSDWKVR